MKFAFGYYRLRNGSIANVLRVHLFGKGEALYGGLELNSKRSLSWNTSGLCVEDSDFDLMEYLKVKENQSHDGPSVTSLSALRAKDVT